jgi:membrane protein DedA with SNARE-associated domain
MSSDWILGLIERGNYPAVTLLMFAENVFPPIPSEVVMPVAGIAAGRGDMSVLLVMLCGTVGAVAGQSLWFWVALRVGPERVKAMASRHGRWLTVSPDDIESSCRWFEKHGSKAVLVGRIVPGIRTLISVPAGLARMSWGRFLLYSTLGSAVWTGVLAYLGYALGERHENITRLIGPISTAVFGAILGYYLYRVATFRR